MSKRTFQCLIISKWLLLILTMILYVTTKKLLPPELRAYFETQQNLPLTNTETIFLWIILGWLVFAFVNSIWLFMFKNWARRTFVLLLIINVLITPIPIGTGYVMTGWTMLTYYLSAVVDGVLIALMYFSPISEMFETQSMD